ncbi:MAG: lysophospholipid acyltransferase family protein [Planctomycetota bacterium]|nr:lysophospholipid acyltransferase family protein [Planctomycetota bacterium]
MARGATKIIRGRKSPRAIVGIPVYLIVRFLGAIIGWMPLGLSLASARAAAWVAYHLDRRHHRIATENLMHAYGDSLSAEERERIILGAYQNLTLNVVEIIQVLRRLRPGEEGRYFELSGEEHPAKVLSAGKGIVLLSGHLGNWEMLSAVARMTNIPIHGVVQPRANPWLEQYLLRVRRSLGAEIVMKKGAVRASIDVLREGKAVGMLVDQNQRRDGIFVDFFGRKASTVRAAALLARRAGAPIVVVYVRRLPGNLRYLVRFLEPIPSVRTSSSAKDIQKMTEQFTNQLEGAIRECPDQWLWLHRRWRTRPPEEKAAPTADLAEARDSRNA